MDATYHIQDLLWFLKSQHVTGFPGIEEVVSIIDSKDIPYEEKEDLLLTALRLYGLHEIGYDPFSQNVDADEIELNKKLLYWGHLISRNSESPVEVWEIRFNDGKIQWKVTIFLN